MEIASSDVGAGLAVLALLLAACTVSPRTSRDALAVTLWEQRGENVGELAYIYCTRATPRERLIFQWGLQRTLGPHQLVITCHRDEGGTLP